MKDRIKEIITAKARDIKPHPLNHRIHPQLQRKTLTAFMDEIGKTDTLNTYRNAGGELVCLDGHLRIDIDPDEEWQVVVNDLTEDEAVKWILMHDRLTDMADIDPVILKEALEQTTTEDVDIANALAAFAAENGVSFGEEPPEDVEPEIDKAEELREKWGVNLGDMWQLGEHRIICGDCTDKAVVDRVMMGERADMVFTDPPYGVDYTGKTKDALKIKNDNMTEDELRTSVEKWFDTCAAVCRPGAYWLATVPPGPLHEVFLSDWKRRGILRQVMVWVKDSMVLGHSEYHYRHEPILFGWIPGDRLKNTDRTKTTVWEFDRPKASREHPTMKPLAMWEYGIEQHSATGDILFEPFSGSGTTIIACERLKRKCRAIEIGPKYVAVSIERWVDVTGGTPELIPLTDNHS